MKKKKVSFFFLLILLFQITISVESENPALLKYVLEWPSTFCIQLNREEHIWCKEPVPQHQFTLHGLMPADEQGHNIEYCHYEPEPNWNDLFEPIRDELVTFWPSLREDFNETELWKHEWIAHGSCGGTTPEEYFHKAIEINYLPQHGNLFNYLQRSGIFPSDYLAYPKEYVVKAIQSVFDEAPHLVGRPRPPPPRPRPSPPPPRPRPSPPPPRPRPSPPPPRPRPSPPPPRPRPSPPPPRPRPSPPPPPRPRPSPPPPPRPRPSPPPPRPRPSPPPPPRPRPSPPPPPRPRPSPPPPVRPGPPPPFVPPPPPSPSRNIYLSCVPMYPGSINHVYLLNEVTLCTNLDGTEFISCPLEADPASCPDDALIMLPTTNFHKGPYMPLLNKWKTPMERIASV